MSSTRFLSRLLPQAGKHSEAATRKVLSDPSSSGRSDYGGPKGPSSSPSAGRADPARPKSAPAVSPVPTCEETDDSTASWGGGGGTSPERRPEASTTTTKIEVAERQGGGEYGPSPSLRRRRREEAAAATADCATPEPLRGGGSTAAPTDDDLFPALPVEGSPAKRGGRNGASTAEALGFSGPAADGGERDDDSQSSSSSPRSAGGYDGDAFLRLQTKRFDSMRNLGGVMVPAAPAPAPPPPAEAPDSAAAAPPILSVVAKTPAAPQVRKGAAPDYAGTPDTAPLSPLTPGTAISGCCSSGSFPPSPPSAGGDAPSPTGAVPKRSTTWRDESRAKNVAPHEYHRTRGNISFRTPQFARAFLSPKREEGAAEGEGAPSDDDGSSSSGGSSSGGSDPYGPSSPPSAAPAPVPEVSSNSFDDAVEAAVGSSSSSVPKASIFPLSPSNFSSSSERGGTPSPTKMLRESAKRSWSKNKLKLSSLMPRGGKKKAAAAAAAARSEIREEDGEPPRPPCVGASPYERLDGLFDDDDGTDDDYEEEVDFLTGTTAAAEPTSAITAAAERQSSAIIPVAVGSGGGGSPSSSSRARHHAPHQTRPDLSQIVDPEGVGAASKLTPFSLWYDDAAAVNMDADDVGSANGLLDTSLARSDGEDSDGDGAGGGDENDNNNNVGIAPASYGTPATTTTTAAAASPRGGSPTVRAGGRGRLVNRVLGTMTKTRRSRSSDGLSFFFRGRGQRGCSSAAAVVYDTESDDEAGGGGGGGGGGARSDSELDVHSPSRKNSFASSAVPSVRMGISRPTRCLWETDDEEDNMVRDTDDEEDEIVFGAEGDSCRGSKRSGSPVPPPPTADEVLASIELGPLHGYMLGRAPDALAGGDGDKVQPVERTVHRQTFQGVDWDSRSVGSTSTSGLQSTRYCTKSLMRKGVDVAGVEGLKAYPLSGARPDADVASLHAPSPDVPAPPSREEMSRAMAGTGASSLQILREMPSEDDAGEGGRGAAVPARKGRATSGAAAPTSVLMSSLAFSANFDSDGESSNDESCGEATPGSNALVEYGSRSAPCSARNLLATSSCRSLVVPVASYPGARRSGQAAPSSRSLTIPSTNALTVVSQDVAAVAPTSKIYVLLIQPQRRLFELIQIVYYPSEATIGDLLDLIPANATEPILGRQGHLGLCRPKDKGPASVLTDLDVLASGTAEGGTANIYRGEILVAIPEGYTGEQCKKMASPILANNQISKLLSKPDPLAPKTRRSRRGRGSGRSGRRGNLTSYRASSSGSGSSLGSISETDESD